MYEARCAGNRRQTHQAVELISAPWVLRQDLWKKHLTASRLTSVMKVSALSVALTLCAASATPITILEERVPSVQGFDISNFQHTVGFQAAYNSGARFVIIKVGGHHPNPSACTYLSYFSLVSGNSEYQQTAGHGRYRLY